MGIAILSMHVGSALGLSNVCVVGAMKMGNTMPRAELEPTSLAFWASVLPLHHIGFPDIITIPTPTCLYSSLPQRPVHTTTDVYVHDV